MCVSQKETWLISGQWIIGSLDKVEDLNERDWRVKDGIRATDG